MDTSLEDKLGKVLWYLNERHAGRAVRDEMGLRHYLDDAEVQGWLDKLNKSGRLNSSNFIFRRP